MKTFNYLIYAVLVSAMCACGDKGSISVGDGDGIVEYDGAGYVLDKATIFTSGPLQDGTYSHNISFLNSATADFFSFHLRNDREGSSVPAGTYAVALTGNITARFSVRDSDQTVTDSAVGTMIVSVEGDTYKFDFAGNSADAKTLSMYYKGKIERR